MGFFFRRFMISLVFFPHPRRKRKKKLCVFFLRSKRGRVSLHDMKKSVAVIVAASAAVIAFFATYSPGHRHDEPNDVSDDVSEEMSTRMHYYSKPVQEYVLQGNEGINLARGDQRSGNCSDNANCLLKNGCLATALGVCYKPPFSTEFRYRPKVQSMRRGGTPRARTIPTGGQPGQELVCSWQPFNPDPLPRLDLDDTSPEGLVNIFKHVGPSRWGTTSG